MVNRCRGNVFTTPLPSNGSLFLDYSGFQPSCYIAPSLRFLVPSRLQANVHFHFSKGMCMWHVQLFSWTAPSHCVGPNASDPGSDNVQPSFLMVPSCAVVLQMLLPLGCSSQAVPWQGASQSSCTTIILILRCRWILYTTTSLSRVTNLYRPSHEGWSLGDFPLV
jgi:hypothetical protein